MRIADLGLAIERGGRGGIGATLVDQLSTGIAGAIQSRRLLPGERLPSVRQLARHLNVSNFTVIEAYQRLVADGVLTARQGSGFRVAHQRSPSRRTSANTIPLRLNAEWLLSEVFADHSVPIKAGCGFVGDISVAAPIFNSAGRVIAAVNMAVPTSRWQVVQVEKKLVPVTVRVAKALSDANAGIDRSNVESTSDGRERVLLLPEDPNASAEKLRHRFRELALIDIGVIINDSIGRAWRLGTVGTAIGVSGLPGLLNLRGACAPQKLDPWVPEVTTLG